MITVCTACADDDGRRLDRILRKMLPAVPISAISRMLRKKQILVDGKAALGMVRVRCGETIEIKGMKLSNEKNLTSENLDDNFLPNTQLQTDFYKNILFEKNGILILNKKCGIASHGHNSLETQVCLYLKGPESLSFKSGPLNRLDKPTTGIIVFGTSLAGAKEFSVLLQTGLIKKTYLALLEGRMEKKTFWEDYLVRDSVRQKTFVTENGAQGAKKALTEVRPLAYSEELTLAEITIKTGRTHQIRACAASRGHPLSGDKKYGSFLPPPFFLHAYSIEFPAGTFGIEKITAPLPEKFTEKIKRCFGNINDIHLQHAFSFNG